MLRQGRRTGFESENVDLNSGSDIYYVVPGKALIGSGSWFSHPKMKASLRYKSCDCLKLKMNFK